MADRIPQQDALRLQLAAIAGNDPPESLLELRCKRRSGRWSQLWFPVRELDRAVGSAINLSELGDVYFGCAPRATRRGGKDAVSEAWCLWADCDFGDSLRQVRSFRPQPSIVNRSGSGSNVHAYWPLREPLASSVAELANKRLAMKLRADQASTDTARVLRAAGTLNHKHEPPILVECIRLELDTFTADQIVDELDEAAKGLLRAGGGFDERAVRLAQRARRRIVAGQVDLGSIPSADYVRALTGRESTPAGFVRCPFHNGGQERTASLHVSEVDVVWFCHAKDCRKGGGVLEFYAALQGRGVPSNDNQFVRFLHEVAGALSRVSA